MIRKVGLMVFILNFSFFSNDALSFSPIKTPPKVLSISNRAHAHSRLPPNYKYKGKFKTISVRMPPSNKKTNIKVYINRRGYPDFEPYAKHTVKISNLTGQHNKDTKLANNKMRQKNRNWVKPEGYVWHHHQDGKTMQLIPEQIHQSIAHKGGASRLRTKQHLDQVNSK